MSPDPLPAPAEPCWRTDPVVVEPPEARPGAWSGAPSAVRRPDGVYLAYRVRLPVGDGRGVANVVARSADGERFETLAVVPKEAFDTDSLERPALVVTPEGRWRLYVSVATPGTPHWRVELLEAATPQALATATPRTVLPGGAAVGVKDPVVVRHDGVWHVWVSAHPLDDPDATDRMTTEHATSADGVAWTWRGTALRPRPGAWDARGVRITAVRLGPAPWALYDGRASAAENWEERTGLAEVGPDGRLVPVGDAPLLQSPHAPHGLRYADVVGLPDGSRRWYYEATRADGAHELRTVLEPPAA